jgi:polyphenol oxidase
VTVLRPALFERVSDLIAAVSTRQGGVSSSGLGMNLSFSVGDRSEDVTENRQRFFGTLGIHLEELAIPRQIHSAMFCRVGSPGSYPDCDALMTDRARVFLCVTVADCIPILLYAPDVRAVAAVHAGWRGTAEGIVSKVVPAMAKEFSCRPESLRAYVGPGASACCYVVGEDVARCFEPAFVKRNHQGLIVDLKAANLAQLRAAGVPLEQIEVSPHCTVSDAANFHSFRRDGAASGRMMAVIGIL